jgi:hypothetical protein
MLRQPFEPDPDKTGVGKRESHSPDAVADDIGTSLKPYSLAILRVVFVDTVFLHS